MILQSICIRIGLHFNVFNPMSVLIHAHVLSAKITLLLSLHIEAVVKAHCIIGHFR